MLLLIVAIISFCNIAQTEQMLLPDCVHFERYSVNLSFLLCNSAFDDVTKFKILQFNYKTVSQVK